MSWVDTSKWPAAWKRFTYRGYTIEELLKMPIEKLAEIAPARQRRSLLRGFTPEQRKLLEKLRKYPKKVVRTHVRDMIVIPEMIGRKIAIHNGKEFVTIRITPSMLFHYLGEFAPTNKPVQHSSPGKGATGLRPEDIPMNLGGARYTLVKIRGKEIGAESFFILQNELNCIV